MTQFYGTLTPEKTEREEKNMQLVRKGAGECMVLLENDGALPIHTKKVELSEIKSIAGVNAILLMTQPENLGGDAIVDVLTGNVNPSGKTANS